MRTANADIALHRLHARPLDRADNTHLLFRGSRIEGGEDRDMISADNRMSAVFGYATDQFRGKVGWDVECLD